MAVKLVVSSILAASILTACGSVPVTTSPDNSEWRLRNFLDNSLSETVRVYNFCYNNKETGFVAARDFKPGSHSIVTKITQEFNNVESEPKQAYATLKGDFVAGSTYVFQKDVDGSEATLWIADVETGKPATDKVQVNLSIPEVVDNALRQQRRCSESTL